MLLFVVIFQWQAFAEKEILSFQSGQVQLKGELYKPNSKPPFVLLFFNHGSAPKMFNSVALKNLAEHFNKEKIAVFMPYRRGQGLSEQAGPYIMTQIKDAIQESGFSAGEDVLIRELKGNHLQDQMAAYRFIKNQDYVDPNKIISIGNSFGGIQVLLGLKELNFCAAINASGGAKSWKKSKKLRSLMFDSLPSINVPVFFFQAQNDYDLSPSKFLGAKLEDLGKKAKIKIYPDFGKSAKEAHGFFYQSVATWFPDAMQFIRQNCLD